MQMEKLFSLKQAVYILNFMGMSYTDLYGMDEKSVLLRNTMYRENTHVFSYYILTAVFMCDFQGFLSWCKYNNKQSSMRNNIRSNTDKQSSMRSNKISSNANKQSNTNKHNSCFIQFEYSDENIEDFGNYIQSIYKSKEVLNGIEMIETQKRDKKDNTVRMSIVEFK